MATDNVDFYARMQRLQKQQHDSEQQRMELEHKFNNYLSSDKRLSRLKAAKLQRVWQKVCEDETRSKARNQQLLSDYHRVESHVAALSTRTERLRLLKDQYERQVELMFPRWKEQLESRRLQQQVVQQRKQQESAMQGRPLSSGVMHNSQHPASTYPSTHNGQASAIGQSSQFLHGTQHGQAYPVGQPVPLGSQFHNQALGIDQSPQLLQHGQTYPVGQSLQMPHGSQAHGKAYPVINSSIPNGSPAQYDAGYMQGPRSQVSSGLSQSIQNGQQMGLNQGQRFPAEEQRLHPSIGNNVSHNPSLSTPSYDALTRNNANVPTPAYVDSQRNYPQPTQDSITRLEPKSVKQPVVQNEDYAYHQTQVPQDRNQSSVNQVVQQEQQNQLPQRGNQEPVQQNVRPNQYNRPKADSVGETSSTISVSSDSQYSGSDDVIRPQIAISNAQQNIKSHAQKNKVEMAPHQNTNRDLVDQGQHQDGHKEYRPPIADTQDTRNTLATPEPRIQPNSGRLPVSSRTEPFSSEGEEEEEEEEDGEEEEEEDEDSAAVREAMQEQLNSGSNPVVRVEVTKHQSPDKQESSPEHAVNGTEESLGEKRETEDGQDESEEEESDSEIGSDMSLPLSDTQNDQVKAGGDTWTAGQGTTSSKTSSEEISKSPSLSEKAFWLLIHTVEMEIDQSDNISGIYNSPNCTEAIKKEIIKSANQNSGLSRLDPNAVSMVIIQTLPSMVASLPGECLMSDKMLSSNRPINEISVRSFIYSAALGFWDRFLKHLERLVKKGVFEPDEVADKFAPLLINAGSNMADKAVDVLRKIVEEVQGEEDSFFDDSSMTLPTPTPQKKPDINNAGNQHLKVPRLNLGDTDRSDDIDSDGSDNDSFFDSKVPLTETDAYQRLLGNTFGTDKPKGDAKQDTEDEEDESSSEDEIEKAARITPTTPTSANRKKRNVLSSLGGSLGISYGSDDDNDDNKLKVTGGGSTQRSDQVTSPSQSDFGSSPSPPGTGYVPSAMENSMKSTARSDPLQRSAAFWGAESDMDSESEMSVPMGTGTATVKSEEDKDDFDFYD